MTGAEFDGVDIDLLADYVGGAMDGTPEAERVAALIAAEPAWQEAFALLAPEMAAVGALLGDLPPEPMPAELAAALDAAFAAPAEPVLPRDAGLAAPEQPATPRDATPATPKEPTTPLDGRLAAPERPATPLDGRLTAPGEPLSPPAPEEPAPGVPKTVVDLDERRRKRGSHRWLRIAAPIGIAAGAVAFLGYGLSRPDPASDAGSSAAAPARGEVMVDAAPALTLTSGLDYTLGTLGQSRKEAPAASLKADSPKYSGETDSSAEQSLAGLRDPAALLDCLNAIAQENGGGPITVESADYARFEGQPALVVRFTAANGPWAWASGPDCGSAGGGADTLGKVPVR
ncbi:hypothetical protein ACTOB_008756 [Actinoplanes oblitus]|uniref:Zinc-finger domain-containing protein n=1 Tax=Actinoplanes oblitus TaxID=3040509 RepID=A0ABY8WGF2_9ACTN|nr:hypothetical protein [Actinoplanes oblitus]WIM96547.1 hypothetical protein ACTOB_008756 [Actinoplanes oblitus]